MKKFFISFFVFLLILFSYSSLSFSKYLFENTFLVADVYIDTFVPDIEFIKVSNNNIGYEKYANKTHIITARIKVKEKNLKINNINKENIKILVDNNIVNPTFLDISLISDSGSEKIYDIKLTNITSNGYLSLKFPEGILVDYSGQFNSEKIFDTKIIIDNIAPETTFQELIIENNKSNGIVTSNEPIRPFNGWNFSNNNCTLSKIFTSPISYPLPILDYAQNSAYANISIQKATNILINYSNYNSYPDTSFKTGGKISGKQAIIDNSINKTESLFINISGDISSSFIQGKAFDYTYWGEDSTALCSFTESRYNYGYNPENSWRYLGSDVHGTCNFGGKLCFKFGGIGQNLAGKQNSTGSIISSIPADIASQYLYGLSSINFKLANYDTYSIIYQIYVHGVGWLPTACDGKETSYKYDKPFSAIRIGLVPKSEKQYVIDFWNKDIGTNNVD